MLHIAGKTISCLILALPLVKWEAVALHCRRDPGQGTVSGSGDLGLVDQLADFSNGFSRKFQFNTMSIFLDALSSAAARNWNPYSNSKMG